MCFYVCPVGYQEVADNIGDAFRLLAEHFNSLANGEEPDGIFGAESVLKISPAHTIAKEQS